MVLRVAGWYKLGWSPEETTQRVDLTLAQVYAALAYYHANYEEIEQQIAEEQALYEQGMRGYHQKMAGAVRL